MEKAVREKHEKTYTEHIKINKSKHKERQIKIEGKRIN